MQTAFAGDHALLVRRETLNLPGREKDVRKGQRRPAEHRANGSGPAFGSIEVQDVRELVREREAQPVVGVELAAARPHRVNHDRVERQGRGVSVGDLGLIREHDVRERWGHGAEPLIERAPRVFRDGRQPDGHAILTLMKVNEKVLRGQDTKPQAGVEQGGPAARGGRAERGRANEQRDDQALCARHLCETRNPRWAAGGCRSATVARRRRWSCTTG